MNMRPGWGLLRIRRFFLAVKDFTRQVYERVRFGSYDQLNKVWLGDFKMSLCWDFGQNMNDVRVVRWNGKA